MKQIGGKLKNARIEKKLTLDDISRETKIKVRYLKNIEEGEFDKIPGGEVYVKGFIKNYANCVDINSKEIIQEYKKIKKEEFEETEDESNQQAAKNIFIKNSLFYIGTGIILIVTIIVSIFFVFKKSEQPVDEKPVETQQKNDNISLNSEVNKKNILEPEELNKPVQNKQIKIVKTDESENNVYYLIDSEKINLKLRTTSDCWILVKVDGNPVFEGTVKNSDIEKEWIGEEKIIIRIGNPLVAELYINDLKLNNLGKSSRNFIFEKSR